MTIDKDKLTEGEKSKCREAFDEWALHLDLCMDEIFMSTSGVPENPFEDGDTKQFYAAWLAAWKSKCVSLKTNEQPVSDYVLVSDMIAGFDASYGGGLFCTEDVIRVPIIDKDNLDRSRARLLLIQTARDVLGHAMQLVCVPVVESM